MNRPSLVTIILALATTICVLVGYTVSVEITKSTSITAKNVTTEKTKGTILYDVNVNDTKGSALKEIVVQIDQTPVDAINNEQKASRPPVSGNATSENSTSVNITLGYSTPVGQNISVVIKTTTKATNLAVVETSPKTNVTITSTTTELISTNLQPKTASTAEVVRFISNKYCYCDQIVSINLVLLKILEILKFIKDTLNFKIYRKKLSHATSKFLLKLSILCLMTK